MSNGLYLATNPGAILRQLFPKQLKSPLMIVIWSIVFILNIVAVVLIQNHLIYNITDFSKEGLSEQSYFEGCEIISVADLGDYYVTYQNDVGEKRVVCLEMFPGEVFDRARLDKSYDCLAAEDGYIEVKEEGILDILLSGNTIAKLAVVYVALGVVLLLVEFFIYDVFHRLFRE